jgi:broad specificity phosphatase PhoE
MITKIYLVRHTQTTGNIEKRLTGRTKYEITKDGEKYIELLTQKLKDIKFDTVYSSTSQRAIKTVEPLASLNKKDIIKLDDLCEMYFGIYDGMKWEEVNRINPKIHENHVKTNEIMGIPEQETTQEVAERMYNCIHKIVLENKGKTILIGSHGVAIEAFLRKITGSPFTEKREEYSQKNTSVNILEYNSEKDKFNLITLNDFSHLNL